MRIKEAKLQKEIERGIEIKDAVQFLQEPLFPLKTSATCRVRGLSWHNIDTIAYNHILSCSYQCIPRMWLHAPRNSVAKFLELKCWLSGERNGGMASTSWHFKQIAFSWRHEDIQFSLLLFSCHECCSEETIDIILMKLKSRAVIYSSLNLELWSCQISIQSKDHVKLQHDRHAGREAMPLRKRNRNDFFLPWNAQVGFKLTSNGAICWTLGYPSHDAKNMFAF